MEIKVIEYEAEAIRCGHMASVDSELHDPVAYSA